MLRRRQFLAGSAATAVLTAGPKSALASARALKNEPLNLRASEIRQPLLPGMLPSRLFLYNGESPGPIIRRRQGERLQVIFHNDLAVPSTIHWHGLRLINGMDGVPHLTQAPVMPGKSFLYDFVLPDAGTYWYHAHFNSLEQVARGLYGPLIIEGDTGPRCRATDIVLTLDDWWIDDQGRFVDGFADWTQGKPGGRIGNIVTVNGRQPGRVIDVPAEAPVRLRLINVANAREFFLELQGTASKVVAVDGQPLEQHHLIDGALRLGPAQRLDLVIQLADRSEASLLETSGTLQNNQTLTTFRAQRRASETASDVDWHAPSPATPDLASALRVPLVMRGGSTTEIDGVDFQGKQRSLQELTKAQQVWAFNQTADLPQQPLFRVKRGTSVRIAMENQTGWSHAMHVHGHHFRVLDSRDDLDAKAWRDTVMIDRNQKLEIAFVADNPGRWLLHCHMLQHAVSGMRTWFEVV